MNLLRITVAMFPFSCVYDIIAQYSNNIFMDSPLPNGVRGCREGRMKLNLDKNILKYCAYVAGTVIFIFLAIRLLDNTMLLITTARMLVHRLAMIIKPLLLGVIIAYLFFPAVRFFETFMERHKVFKKRSTRRSVGILLTYLIVLGVIIAIICGIYIMIGGRLTKITSIGNVIDYIVEYMSANALSMAELEQRLSSLNIDLGGELANQITGLLAGIQTYVSNSINNMFSSAVTLGSNVIAFFASFILSIYLIQDSEYFLRIWNKFFYLVFRKSWLGNKLKEAFHIFNETFSNYISGQFLEACFVAIMSTIALAIIKLPDALIIGIIAGITNMIPYVGPWIGTGLGMATALLSGNWLMAFLVLVAMQVVQQIDNNLLAPRVVGEKVGLHPVFTMTAIFMGGNMGGLMGMLIAVPIFASVKTMLSNWYAEFAPKIGAPMD